MTVLIDKQYNWQKLSDDVLVCWYIGSERAVSRFVAYLNSHQETDLDDLKKALLEVYGNFAVIARINGRIIAAVDKIRSYPIFYYHNGSHFQVSNSARALKETQKLEVIDDLSLLEFSMAGYVTGRETLYRDLYQLEAGEVLCWTEKGNDLKRERYYLFFSNKFRKEPEESLIGELDEVTNRVFLRALDEVNGAPIWVPLSGGLDSRLVLCKLKSLGYNDITAFSYGPKANYEAKAAKEVSERVGVPWYFVPVSMKESKQFFFSSLRKQYWDFSDGLTNIPNIQDIHPLLSLKNDGRLPRRAVVINGQSGDFITGGHIPSLFMDEKSSMNLLLQRAVEKHYSQWLNLKTEDNLHKIWKKILYLLDTELDAETDRQRLASLYELWEWQERQCKYVINGQRIYDFLDMGWQLPLWADEYLEFWSQIPLDLKYGQKLYKNYLNSFDFFKCFKTFNPTIWRWPGLSIAVVPIARVLKLLSGEKASSSFYHYMKYIGHYRPHFAPYGWLDYIKRAPQIRGALSLNVKTWFEENDLEFLTSLN